MEMAVIMVYVCVCFARISFWEFCPVALLIVEVSAFLGKKGARTRV